MPDNPSKSDSKSGRLRCGFSSGTAAAAAAKAACATLSPGVSADAVAVRLPSGVYLAVPVAWSRSQGGTANASVIKDGGDDPDITNGAEIRATVSILRHGPEHAGQAERDGPEILLVAGKGVGLVTKPGLAAAPGERP